MNKEIAKMQKIAGLLKENLEEGSGSQTEKLEGLLSNLIRNVSTDSNIPTASKEGLLNAFNEMMDIVQDILGSEEADSFYDDDDDYGDDDDDYGSDNPEDGYGPRIQEDEINEAAYVPDNVAKFSKRKGVSTLVNKVAGWAEKAGKRIKGGTAIGKNYDTLLLDLNYQDGAIRIDIPEGTIELYGEPVFNEKSFAKALAANDQSIKD